MILSRLQIHTFGCFINHRMDFKEGLNVVLGPNEAGKSTLFHAVQKTLLVPSRLKKLDFEREMVRFLPVGGGDTVETELEFRIGSGRFVLRRSWGSRPGSQLVLPEGSALNDENAIREKLETLLPARPGTFKSVLMSYQSGLARTIEELKSDPTGALQSLSDILRRAVLETDGVSIDRFKGRVEALYDRHFSHWDSKQSLPEKGKGVENPWVKEVGEILRAFYGKERIRISLKKARDYEERLDALNGEIQQSAKQLAEGEAFLRRNKKPVEDAREHRTLEAELRALQSQIEMMKKANSEWPVSERKIEETIRFVPSLEEKRESLQMEKKEVEIEEKNKGLREKVRRILQKKEALQQAEEKFRSVHVLQRADLEEIRKASGRLHQMKASLEAGKLSVHLKTKEDSAVTIQRDFDPEFLQKISKDAPLRLEAGGRVRLTHSEWEIEVTSGKTNFNEKQQAYHQTEEHLGRLLHNHGVDTLEQAIEANRIYEDHLTEVNKAGEQLSAERGTEAYEDLESKVRAVGEQKATRPIAEVIEELARLQYQIEGVKKDLVYHQDVVSSYEGKYTSKDHLLLDLAEAVRKEKHLTEKIGQLSALPEDAADPNTFVRHYEQIQTEVEQMREKRNELLLRRADLEKEAPEASAEELGQGLSEAEEQFASVVKQGKAIERIRTLTQSLLGKMDAGTFTHLKKELEEAVSQLTARRYTQIEMTGCLPQGFLRGDGNRLPYELLSQGTMNILSLALRLVMAEYFLNRAEGFLMMDDPLVDLDPERQKRAGEKLKVFAEKRQLLIFTCHPSSADLLGGHLIRLGDTQTPSPP
jgi:exonuclease SbcC